MSVLSRATPAAVGLCDSRLGTIDSIVQQAIAEGQMTGCVVLVGRRGRIAYLKAFGDRQTQPVRETMMSDTLFDLASLTKPIATATSVMILFDARAVDLDAPASRYLPEFTGAGKESIT